METLRKCIVLVVDAEPLARRGLVDILQRQSDLQFGGEAGSIAEARDLSAQLQPPILVLDPAQEDGFAFIKELPRWSALTRVVALTRLEDAESVQRAFQCGAHGYVTRRDPAETVLTAIQAALRGERYLGPRAQRALLGELARGSMHIQEDELTRLSHRERDVFSRIGAGHATRLIAEELHMSVKTVETHRQRIREKLGLASGAELIRRAVLSCGRAVPNG